MRKKEPAQNAKVNVDPADLKKLETLVSVVGSEDLTKAFEIFKLWQKNLGHLVESNDALDDAFGSLSDLDYTLSEVRDAVNRAVRCFDRIKDD